MSKQETPFEESQRLCRERDKANAQIVQMRKALEKIAEPATDSPKQVARASIAELDRSGAW